METILARLERIKRARKYARSTEAHRALNAERDRLLAELRTVAVIVRSHIRRKPGK